MPSSRWIPSALVVVSLIGTACGSGTGGASPSATPVPRQPATMDVHAHAAAGSLSPTESPTGPEPGETFASPPADRVPPGTRVPDLSSMDFEDAVITLRKLGLDFGEVYARPSDRPQWSVLSENPDPGSLPRANRRVDLLLSAGPSVGVVGVGSVKCKPEEDDIDLPYCLGKLLRY